MQLVENEIHDIVCLECIYKMIHHTSGKTVESKMRTGRGFIGARLCGFPGDNLVVR